jgi:hypothetical protein
MGIFWKDLKMYSTEEFLSIVNSLTSINQLDGGMLCDRTLWFLGHRERDDLEHDLEEKYGNEETTDLQNEFERFSMVA